MALATSGRGVHNITINHTLQLLALLDGLTGLANRRQFDTYLYQSLERSRKERQPLSLIMIDVDFFKRYNDTYGHVAGDICLKKVGSVLNALAQRKGDLATRYGGEEFAVILPRTGEAEAKRFAERVVMSVRKTAIGHNTTDISEKIVTVSAGCASLLSVGLANEAEIIKERADQALYEAKRAGRNCARNC